MTNNRTSAASRSSGTVEPFGPAGPRTTQLVRSVIDHAGSVTTTVTITERHDHPVLHVRAGGVLVYAATPAVVAAHLVAWRETTLAARQMFPAVVPRPGRNRDGEVSLIVRQDAPPGTAVTRYPAAATGLGPGRLPWIETVTGPLSWRSTDRAAPEALHDIWQQAAHLGAIVWRTPALTDI